MLTRRDFMKQITINLKNEPGALCSVCDAIERVGVNILSLFCGALNSKGIVHLITEDEETTKKTLEKVGYNPTTSDVLLIKLQDKPGELAKVLRKLAFSKVNIETILLLTREKSEVTLALKTDNIKKAKEAISL